MIDNSMITVWHYDIEEKHKEKWTLNQVIDYLNDLCDDSQCFSLTEAEIDNVIVDESQ